MMKKANLVAVSDQSKRLPALEHVIESSRIQKGSIEKNLKFAIERMASEAEEMKNVEPGSTYEEYKTYTYKLNLELQNIQDYMTELKAHEFLDQVITNTQEK